MDANNEENRELKHKLGNVRAENEALKSLLGKAADRLEDVVESDCDEGEQEKALSTAERLRTAIDLSSGKSSTPG
ncbi:hypothetical protein B2G71_06720 [Novosphingobium sp. PC22D]|uniref:hypothetical protein n=1 Tax=Novosphingobium sp. PC22D TaxID=1962403 RepID=UPI000BF05493|nr:hypothetical protein [Novosphingobium sp. PC22D]PEQ13141.1 hypothetical protein B2G71_06720 [Novosphingobium sp. PC22D]